MVVIVNFCNRFYKNQLHAAQFTDGHRHYIITEWLNVGRVHMQNTAGAGRLLWRKRTFNRNSEDLFVCEENKTNFVLWEPSNISNIGVLLQTVEIFQDFRMSKGVVIVLKRTGQN